MSLSLEEFNNTIINTFKSFNTSSISVLFKKLIRYYTRSSIFKESYRDIIIFIYKLRLVYLLLTLKKNNNREYFNISSKSKLIVSKSIL